MLSNNYSTKILFNILLSILLITTNRLIIIIIISSFILAIIFIHNKNRLEYLNILKNTHIWLFLLLILYIILSKNLILSIIFIYKIIILFILFYYVMKNSSFKNIDLFINKLLKFLSIFKINTSKLSYNMSINLFSIYYYIKSGEVIYNMQGKKNRYSIKYYIMPRFFMTMDNINKLSLSLKLRNYKLKKEKESIQIITLNYILCALIVLVIVKDVIL